MHSRPGFDVMDLVTEPVILPELSRSFKVLNALKMEGTQVCFIVNEYGGLKGIITQADILETIMGQFPTSEEISEQQFLVREDGSYLIDGDVPVEFLTELVDDFKLEFEHRDYSTIAGFFIDKLSRIPKTGDKLRLSGFIMEIVDMDGNRIDKVLLTKSNPENQG